MRESSLQRRCLQLARERYRGRVVAVNVHGGGYSNKGFPDLLLLGAGKAVAVELKSPTSGYKVQPDQAVWKRRLEEAGVAHHVVSDLPSFGRVMKEEFDDQP